MFTNFWSRATFQALAHGTFQGSMTAVNGGSFWNGFAAGALSSIASSAWQGGSTFETLDDVTTETIHKGISGATGLSNGFGTIAFGTLSGGAGAALTGGNFWQGAVTGLVVSALNHTFHGTPNKSTGLSSRRYTKDSNGNITSESLNYFSPKNDTDLFNRAESEPLRMGELTIYAHGNQHGFANIYQLANSNLIVKKLYTDSVMYRNFKNGQTKNLTMNIKACTTGETSYGRNIANILSIPHGITIYAAAG
ncbi:hypothetical protein [Flavobacterium branchiophilum]|uniref:Uncharacterized protein n=1 Tax=Flavobacterium branchiophilum TaxID=55197 RepID=A0A2H3KC51_9FLAO|nr:hypothetical protein [Flavobacterium branchiophilum]PDS24830.1 hypothetical protein B0A77_06805 [Flavobacterium branchiophilum]